MFTLEFTEPADSQLKSIEADKSNPGLTKQVKKALGYLQTNPRHQSLKTHHIDSIPNPINPKEKIFEAYAQNNTPSAYRIFFAYGSVKKTKEKIITILAITPHP